MCRPPKRRGSYQRHQPEYSSNRMMRASRPAARGANAQRADTPMDHRCVIHAAAATRRARKSWMRCPRATSGSFGIHAPAHRGSCRVRRVIVCRRHAAHAARGVQLRAVQHRTEDSRTRRCIALSPNANKPARWRFSRIASTCSRALLILFPDVTCLARTGRISSLELRDEDAGLHRNIEVAVLVGRQHLTSRDDSLLQTEAPAERVGDQGRCVFSIGAARGRNAR